jgi:hypothetical protein
MVFEYVKKFWDGCVHSIYIWFLQLVFLDLTFDRGEGLGTSLAVKLDLLQIEVVFQSISD